MNLFTDKQLDIAKEMNLEIIFDNGGGCVVQTATYCHHFSEVGEPAIKLVFDLLDKWEACLSLLEGWESDWGSLPQYRCDISALSEHGERGFAAADLNSIGDCEWGGNVDEFIKEINLFTEKRLAEAEAFAAALQALLNDINGSPIWTVVLVVEDDDNYRIYDPGGEYDCPRNAIEAISVKIAGISEVGEEGFNACHEILTDLLGPGHG